MTTMTAQPMFSCPAPQWADEATDWLAGTVEHSRFAKRPQRVSAWVQQTDEIDVTDVVVTLVRHQPTIMLQFDNKGVSDFDSDFLPLDQYRGGWLPVLPDTITADRPALAREAVAELLAAYDRAELAAP